MAEFIDVRTSGANAASNASLSQAGTPHPRNQMVSPGNNGTLDMSEDFDGHAPLPTPLISKELSMVTRELSMIARQGTTLSLLGKERSMTDSPSLRNRAGLVSRMSILPIAFASPRPDMDIDNVSCASILHMSFMFKHAPSMRMLTKEVLTEQVDLEDDDLQCQVEETIKKQQYLFPKSCFEIESPDKATCVFGTEEQEEKEEEEEEEEEEGVIVDVHHQDVSMTNSSHVNKSNNLANSSSPSGTSRRTRISIDNKSLRSNNETESLPLVSPRAIFLTPEPADIEHKFTDFGDAKDLNDERPNMLSPIPSKSTVPPIPRKHQIMVCLKSIKKLKKSQKNKKKVGVMRKAVAIEDIFREMLDIRGFDFVNLTSPISDNNPLLLPFNIDEDISVVLECMKWPHVAQRWFQRERSHWPSEEVIKELKTVPCHVTPFPIKDKNNFKFLKRTVYSYPLVDNILFGSLTQKQHNAFAVLLTLYQKHFSEPLLLQLAHVKAVFFWACEQTPVGYWKDSELATGVFYVLNQLIECLNKSNLPHYITEENMLVNAGHDTVKEIADMVRLVRKTPIESLINSNHFSPYDENLCEPVLNYMMSETQTWDAVSSIVLSAIKIGQSYIPEPGKEYAVQVLDDACQVVFQFRHFDGPAIALVQVTADLYSDLCNLDRVIEYTEYMAYIAYEYENDNLDLSLCLSRLATLYHCKAQEPEGEIYPPDMRSRSTWLHRAHEYFDLALLEDYSLISVLHYAIYLLKEDRAIEALEQLTNAIALTDETDEDELLQDVTTFSPLEVNTLDEDLAQEVRMMGSMMAPTVVMGYYHLCRALLDTGISKGLEEYTLILEILAESKANKHQSTTWALLGYVQTSRKDKANARRAFKAALELKQDYGAVKNKMGLPHLKNGCGGSTCCVLF